MLFTKDKVCKRWREYFKELIGNDGDRDVSIGIVGKGVGMEKEK